MSTLVCELCNSNDLLKENGVYVCQHCGTKYTIEEAKKLLGTVKIDRTDELEKLLQLARRARDLKDSENAEKYYSTILQEDPNSWEALFFQLYFRALKAKIAEFLIAVAPVSNSIGTIYQLIANIEDASEKKKASDVIVSYSFQLVSTFASSAEQFYYAHSNVSGTFNECISRLAALMPLYDNLESALKEHFPNDQNTILEVQKAYCEFLCKYRKFICAQPTFYKTETRLTAAIRTADPTYQKPEPPKSSGYQGCYVATAVYGSYDCPEVWTLRRYRDSTLAETWYGRGFIRAYYAVSPTLVKWFGNTAWFKKLWKGKLDRMVKNLQAQGYDSTPYEDKRW